MGSRVGSGKSTGGSSAPTKPGKGGSSAAKGGKKK